MTALIVTYVLKYTIGALWGQTRDHTARKLQDGDLTDEQCRKLIVRSMVELKAKLDALSRKDLLTSINLIREGATLLIALESSDSQQMELASVVNVFDQLKSHSNERLVAARQCFKTAREEATRAFSNTALSIEDRIMATKLRITARILESLHEPDVAGLTCQSFIKQLHEVPSIQEIFNVCLRGGVRSIFKKKKRLEIAKSVVLINFALYSFIMTSTKIHLRMLEWPTIQAGRIEYNPVLQKDEILLKGELQECSAKELSTSFQTDAVPGLIRGVNSNGELIVKLKDKPSLAAMKNEEHIKTLFHFSDRDTKKKDFTICGITIDKDDNMYINTRNKKSDGTWKYQLFIIDKQGNIKYQCVLEFLRKNKHYTNIAVNLNGDIIFVADSKYLYICDNTGNIKSTHSLPTSYCKLGGATDTNDILVADREENVVHIFNENGTFKRKLDIPKAFEFPVKLRDVAFCFSTKTIVVSTQSEESEDNASRYYLVIYQDEDHVPSHVIYLCSDYGWYGNIYSHATGLMLVTTKTKAILF